MNNKIYFNWDLHYACNYRCPYCWFHGRWHQLARENKYLSIDEVLKAWENIYKKYGSVYIELLGGEPFIYPNFTELIKKLSHIHAIGITTNLSIELDNFIKEVDSSKVRVSPTFHPLFADFDKFINRALLLREKGMISLVNYLAYPPQIKFIKYYKERFDKYGIPLSVMTFWGQHNGITYPEGYTQQERESIELCLGDRQGEKFQLKPKSVKGKLCKAGQIYADIKADGKVLRCGGSYPHEIGNLFNDDFKLLDNPLPCESELCPCNEWAGLLVEKEETMKKKLDDMQSCQIFTITEPKSCEAKKEIDRKSIAPHRVFITWDIHYGCNYRCTYCNTPKPGDSPSAWDRNRTQVVYLEANKWLKIWEDIYVKYGSCEIHITGGEPFVYPAFLDLISGLSKIHTLEIITNFSSDANDIIRAVTPDRVRIGTTFHPEFSDLDEFLKKHVILREHGFETWSNYVAYPPILDKMGEYKSRFDKLRISFNIQPFMGKFQGREYPAGYTNAELSYLKNCYSDDDIINKKTIEWKTSTDYRKTKGRSCRMGQMYAKIYPTGDAYRCCANGSEKLGNLIDGSFKLLDEALPCECDLCFCWRCMLAEEEGNWKDHWRVPEKKTYKLNV